MNLNSDSNDCDTQNVAFFEHGISESEINAVLNSTKLGDMSSPLKNIDLSPVRSLKTRLELLKENAIKNLPSPANLKERYRFKDVKFKITQSTFADERDRTSIFKLKQKFQHFHFQQEEEKKKSNTKFIQHSDSSDSSNLKLLALKKTLKAQMVEKRKKDYEKRVQLFKLDNEECEEIAFNDEEEEISEEKEVLYENKKCSQEYQFENIEENSNKNSDQTDSPPVTQHIILSPFDNKEECESPIKDNKIIKDNRETLSKIIASNQSQIDSEQLLQLCSGKILKESDDEDESDDGFELKQIKSEDSDENSNESILTKNENDAENNVEYDVKFKRPTKYNLDSDDENSKDNDFIKKFRTNFNKKRKIIEDDEESNSDDEIIEDYSIEKIDEPSSSFLDNDDRSEENKDLNDKLNQKQKEVVLNAKDFIEDQAELSEEDRDNISSDEEDDLDDYENEVTNEQLPSDDEIIEQNNKIYLKQKMDEDKRELLEYQERFLENGDLHNDGEIRHRKFKWKNADNVWVDNARDSEDSDEFDFDDENIEYTSLHLKPLTEVLNEKKSQDGFENTSAQKKNESTTDLKLNQLSGESDNALNTSLNKSHINSYSTFDNNCFSKHMKTFRKHYINGPTNDIQSYIIKDKNLLNAISLKRGSNTTTVNKPKKLKTITKKTNTKSIFDVFNM